MGDVGSWWKETSFQENRDTGFLLQRLEELWAGVRAYKPLSVGVTLLDLVPSQHHHPDLFEQQEGEDILLPVVDGLNRRFGRNTIGLGQTSAKAKAYGGRAAFQRAPESWEF